MLLVTDTLLPISEEASVLKEWEEYIARRSLDLKEPHVYPRIHFILHAVFCRT